MVIVVVLYLLSVSLKVLAPVATPGAEERDLPLFSCTFERRKLGFPRAYLIPMINSLP